MNERSPIASCLEYFDSGYFGTKFLLLASFSVEMLSGKKITWKSVLLVLFSRNFYGRRGNQNNYA